MSKKCQVANEAIDESKSEHSNQDDEEELFWNLCALCQTYTIGENLQCPANSTTKDVGAGYRSFAKNINEFVSLGTLPIFPLRLRHLDDGSGIDNTLMTNRASWHKSCHNKFDNQHLKCTKTAVKCKNDSSKEKKQHQVQ